MVRKNKTRLSKIISLLLLIALSFTVFTSPVSAESGEKDQEQKDRKSMLLQAMEAQGDEEPEPEVVVPVYEDGGWKRMHSDSRVFDRNYVLSPEVKEYSITEYEKVASEIRDSSKSDLEKYYKLAIWLNKYVSYDWSLWSTGYDMDYYSHQWDAYGVLKERLSICAGIAVAYANICHAADLPCKFVRAKPYYLDHTINYIPDINGHPYYIDVTEDMFFMSDNANPYNPMDLGFSHIPEEKIPDDGSFEYQRGRKISVSPIKEYYDTPFEEWYKEYALHENTDREFKAEYVEKGSGNGEYHASYKDYPKQFSDTEKPGIWFLEDFYKDPDTIESKIRNKELDGQLLEISGIKGNYDCDTAEELEAAVAGDMTVKYFPSLENDEVVAKAASLEKDTDYTVTCNAIDVSTGEAKLTIKGAGDYKGEYEISARVHSAAVTKVPVNNMDLEYTGESQTLVEPGEAENGTMLYAVLDKGDSDAYPDILDFEAGFDPKKAPDPESFTDEIPAAADVGRYIIWYMVKGDEGYCDTAPQRLERVAIINPVESKILIDDITVRKGETVRLEPELNSGQEAVYSFSSLDSDIATVDDDGLVEGIAEGTTDIFISADVVESSPNYTDPRVEMISVTVTEGKRDVQKLTDTIIEAVKTLGQGSYTSESVQRMKTLIETANTVVDKDDPTQEEIDAAYTDLLKGLRSLDPVDKEEKRAASSKATDELIRELNNIYDKLSSAVDTNKKPAVVSKESNPMTVKGKTADIKYSKVKKKAQTIKRSKVITVSKAQGKLTYKLLSAKKGKTSYKKYFKINAKSGKVTVKKGIKKGTYKVRAKVKAAGNDKYKASDWKKVTFTVGIK